MLKSKTLWFNLAIAVVGALEMHQGVILKYVGQENIGLALMILGLLGAILRVVTTQALSDK